MELYDFKNKVTKRFSDGSTKTINTDGQIIASSATAAALQLGDLPGSTIIKPSRFTIDYALKRYPKATRELLRKAV